MEQNWMTGKTLNQMRLIVEGAIVLYENDLAWCYKQALGEGRADEALALDMLGTTLHELRQSIRELQTELVKSSIC